MAFPRSHRGGATLTPGKTIAGLLCGLEHGYRAAEFDLMLSADGVPVPVPMHDPAFGRTVPGLGNGSETSAQLLATMDAGRWFGPKFAGEPVPSFADVIAYCKREGIWMNAEIKSSPGYAAETGRAAAAQLKQMLVEDDAMALHTNHKILEQEQAIAIKDAVLRLFCYTVDDPEISRRLLDWGVDAFCTDRVDLIGADFASGAGS